MQLVVEDVSKDYRGGVRALRHVQLSSFGGVRGLLGPNGAGKSTLMRILATIMPPTTGRVSYPLFYLLLTAALVVAALVGRPRQLRSS